MDFKQSGLVLLITLAYASSSTTPASQGCACPLINAPVCGSDGKLYPNQCVLDCHNSIQKSDVTVLKLGSCSDEKCLCSSEDKAVCGTDGQTYKNICLLQCARLKKPSLEVFQQGACSKHGKRSKRRSGYESRYNLHSRSNMCNDYF